jgi:ribosomal-protein-alanine N-acetyltransferase
LWAVCDPDNPASSAVLRKIGMQLEGVMRGDLLVRGTRRDSLLHAMVVTDATVPGTYL